MQTNYNQLLLASLPQAGLPGVKYCSCPGSPGVVCLSRALVVACLSGEQGGETPEKKAIKWYFFTKIEGCNLPSFLRRLKLSGIVERAKEIGVLSVAKQHA